MEIEKKTPGQFAYEARQVAKGRRMGAGGDETDAQVVVVIGLAWDELPAGMQADEEAGARAVLDNRTPWGDVNVVGIEMNPRYAVVRNGGPDGEVTKVIGYGPASLRYYDSIEQLRREAVNGDDPSPAPTAPERPREGWSRIIPPQKKSHYFVKGRSLCLRYGFPPEPLSPDEYASPDDCAACRKKLSLRKLDQAALAKGRQS